MYAKFIDDSKLGILMVGIYFGGLCDTKIEADKMAVRCVKSNHSGMIMPRIMKMISPLHSSIKDMCDQFQQIANRIYDNEQTISK